MFGRQPRIPVDIAFCLPVKDGSPKSHSQYVKQLKARLEESYQIATKNSQKVADRNKRRFDRAVRESTLEEGDRVLIKNLRFRSKHKLADKWESTMYKVLERVGDLPVYRVQSINGDGPIRTLHRDLLLACGDLPEEEEPEPVKPKVRKPRTRQNHPQLLEELSEPDDDFFIYSDLSYAVPEKRFTQVCEIPRQEPTATPECGGLPAVPLLPLTSQPQGSPDCSNLPAVPVETPPELVDGGRTEVMVEQSPAGEDSTQQDMTHEEEKNVTNGKELDKTNGTEEENPIGEGTVGVLQGAEPNPTQAPKAESGSETERKPPDTIRRSERSRQGPNRFHYIQFGKPFMSFAQNILESFNLALDTISNYDNPHVNERAAHEGTHADSRGEGVTHMVTKPTFVI
ncbi:hypothetical protein D9C73_027976 [Collichthys lucidus]|uniref:Retrovirus-related Pol polyprotein from transposon 412 n=1 Tax=Collichthys lucidus TaxID=240159 RepID=A0A4U5TVY2_COLLU|nr:hypothetical protein D9C73_027976 [Collichthys lucidus]